jgi:hypothetical protein
MAEASAPVSHGGGVRAPASARSLRLIAPAIVFIVASLAAIASDLATPLGTSIGLVGAGLVVAMAVLGVMYLRSMDSGHEASFAALVLPVALCAYAVFLQREGPPGQPASGVVAQAFPAVERWQAGFLSTKPGAKAALTIEAILKTGDAAAKAAAIQRIGEQPSRARREYLYETAARFGDRTRQQLIVAILLGRLTGRSVPVELQTEDNFTIYQQYLEGSSIRFDSIAPRLRARLRTNKETVAMSGALAGPSLRMTGSANLADVHAPVTMTAAMGPDLTFSGTFHFATGEDAPFVLHAF